MLTTGPNLGLLDNGGYAEHVYSEVLRLYRMLDLLVQPHVKSASIAVPPTSPNEGDAYIVPPGALGEWAGLDGKIVRWSSRSALIVPTWEAITPRKNWTFGVDDIDQELRFNGSAWVGSNVIVSDQPPSNDDGRPDGTIYIQV